MGKCVSHHINTLMMEAETVSKMLDPSITIHKYIHTYIHTYVLYFINPKSLIGVGYEICQSVDWPVARYTAQQAH